jgi:hypothetical protein
MWAEVKPGDFTDREMELAYGLSGMTGFPVLLLAGVPENKPYLGIIVEEKEHQAWQFCLTNYHDYPQKEHRFFVCPADYERAWNDTGLAVDAAKSARFEFGDKA